ncbi:phage major capsid protein [Granulicella mallensis]|uniref:HK97 family phage major capsid protein n=1 Tax=Granulicella mallensis TaxID=940614 RepID=A0A7W7ZU12_9BACT|nr:phage major capsid protein [Granulicella mallensis]MBB5066150.1 HK97 family phage major capsid protein [Granulicella mallensis]
MSIALLQEKRNKLMADSGAILANENSTTEQLASADTMLTEATGLEKRIASLKTIEAHEAEQRAFQPAERPSAEQTNGDQRTRLNHALRSFMLTNQIPTEYRDVLTTSTSGAAVIPQLMNPELVTAMREFAPVLQIVDNRVTDNNGAPMKMSLVNYTSTLLPLVAEGTAFPEIDPAFTSTIVSVDKLGGIVKLSAEELADSKFDLPTWLTQQWANVVGVSLEHYVTLGNASNIAGFTALAGAGAETATAGVIAYPDIAALYGSVTAAYARNGSWQMSTSTRAALMGLTATTGTPIFDANPAGNPFTTIFGRPVIINDSLPALATGNKAILFGDFQLGYLLRTDGLPTIKRLDERFADTDEVGFIIRTRVGGVSKNAGISPFNALLIR